MKQLINLPIELLTKILDELDLQDIKKLSILSEAYNEKLQNFIFKTVKLTWGNVDKFLTEMNLKLKYVTKVIVYNDTGDSYGEWNINLLEKFHKVPRLNFLEIRLLKSTNCLKYQSFIANEIKSLKLTTSVENSIFSLYHVKNFNRVEAIYLTNFQIIRDLEEININEQENHLQLKKLYLTNCNWDWPFDLNFYPNLTCLELYYETTNPFILGERFRDFLSDKTKLENLQDLKIEIDDSNDKSFYLYPSFNSLNLINLKNLQRLTLINFKNLDFKKFYDLINQLNLQYLHLQLIKTNNNDLDFHDYEAILKSKIPNVKINTAT